MSNTVANNPLDKTTAIAAAIVICFVGNAVFMGMPILVGSIADTLGFNEQQAGWIASGDLGGMFIASIVASRLVTRVNRRYIAVAGMLIAISANLTSIFFHQLETLLSIRIISGFGSGLCYATGVACLAGTHHTARNFSALMFALVAINALELYSFPILSASWGVNGIFVAFTVAFVASLSVVHWIPGHIGERPLDVQSEYDDETGHHQKTLHVPTYLPWMCLAAVACFYITVGSFWAFIERAGVDAGLTDSFIANVLTIGTVFTLAGCIVATWLSGRFGQSKPLLAALLLMALNLLALSFGVNLTSFIVCTMAFNFCWLFTDIYQLGTLSNIDRSGRYAALVPGAQGLAQTIGPSIAGYLIVSGLGYGSVMILGALGSGAAFVLYVLVYARMKAIAPEVAEATA